MTEILLTEKEMTFRALLYFHVLLKVIIPDGRFSRFLNCTNGIKSCNASKKLTASGKVILDEVLK